MSKPDRSVTLTIFLLAILIALLSWMCIWVVDVRAGSAGGFDAAAKEKAYPTLSYSASSTYRPSSGSGKVSLTFSVVNSAASASSVPGRFNLTLSFDASSLAFSTRFSTKNYGFEAASLGNLSSPLTFQGGSTFTAQRPSTNDLSVSFDTFSTFILPYIYYDSVTFLVGDYIQYPAYPQQAILTVAALDDYMSVFIPTTQSQFTLSTLAFAGAESRLISKDETTVTLQAALGYGTDAYNLLPLSNSYPVISTLTGKYGFNYFLTFSTLPSMTITNIGRFNHPVTISTKSFMGQFIGNLTDIFFFWRRR